MKKYPKKLFNRTSAIPHNICIYTSRKGGQYYFIGIRDKRKGNECLFYAVPNNKDPKYPNLKGISKSEVDELWSILLKQACLTTKEACLKFPGLAVEGKCFMGALYGVINFLHPNEFEKRHGMIIMKNVTQFNSLK